MHMCHFLVRLQLQNGIEAVFKEKWQNQKFPYCQSWFYYQSASLNKWTTIYKKLWEIKLLQAEFAKNGAIRIASLKLKKGWI